MLVMIDTCFLCVCVCVSVCVCVCECVCVKACNGLIHVSGVCVCECL